jgi:polysaccharide export outer membrane protein
MSRSCDPFDISSERSRRHDQVTRPRDAAFLFVMLAVCSCAGCRTADYSARNLPLTMQAPPMGPSANVNLQQIAGEGVNTSEICPGDLVSVTIVSGNGDEKVTPIPARVAQDGTVMVPLVGPVQIGGVEPVTAEQRIATTAIERGIYRQPYVTLTIMERAVNRVTVLGAVAKPGVVELPRGSSDVASALAAAGGTASNAGTKIEILHRATPPVAVADPTKQPDGNPNAVKVASYTEPVQPTAASKEEVTHIDLAQAGPAEAGVRRLQDRDVVNVLPEEKRLIHVTGLVQKPDQFELSRDKEYRVLDAIAMAGGTSSVVADKVFVIRQLPNMPAPVVIKVSIARAKREGAENVRLAEGDLVSVESTTATMAFDTVSKFFRVAFGLSGSMAMF